MNTKYLTIAPLKTLCILVICSTLLYSCKTQNPQSNQSSVATQPPIYTVEPTVLASDGQAIMLARDLIKEKAIASAIGILKPFELEALALNEQQLYVLARIELAIARNDVEEADYWVAGQYSSLFDRASKLKQMTLRFLRSDVASMQKDYLSAARERIFIDQELYGAQKQWNHDVIWANLLKLDDEEIDRFLRSANTHSSAFSTLDIIGWLQLAKQLKRTKGQIYLQQLTLQRWINSHAQHPASMMLPSVLSNLDKAIQNQPNQVAVLAPMTGKYSIVGRSIQAGLLSEYYDVAQQQSERAILPTIEFYDTATQTNIVELYKQAVFNGAQFVIGPFFEKPVNELAAYEALTVPVLLLRSTQVVPAVPENVMQFDLSLNHEVDRLAKQAYVDGHRNVAIIHTKDSKRRGEFAQIFSDTFTGLGGTVVAMTQLDTKQKYIASVKELMGIDASEQRASAVYDLLKQNANNFEVRPRKDIDMIFMAVSQDESVRLKPIFNQQYAQEIPFYALSEIYSGGQLPKQYDFDNIRLQTMPWKLQGVTHDDLSQRDKFDQAYQANEASVSIAAQGVDAYNIMMQFEIFKLFPENVISGVTGTLYQPSKGVIHTKRDWVIINNNQITAYDRAE